jgi:hypothetical protein
MTFFDDLPLESVAAHLREQADELSGVQGAVLGAGLGVVTALAAMKAAGRKPNVSLLLTGAAVGMAYGATDKKRILGK